MSIFVYVQCCCISLIEINLYVSRASFVKSTAVDTVQRRERELLYFHVMVHIFKQITV